MAWKYGEGAEGLRFRYQGGKYPVGDFIVPQTLEATFERPDLGPHRVQLRIEVTFDDRVQPEVASVSVTRSDGGPPVRSQDVRVPVAELATEALLAVSHVIVSRSGTALTARPATGADREALDERLREKQPSRRWRLTPEHLREVVEIYRAGELLGRPVMHVAEHWNVPRPTASRWIAKARAEPGYFDTSDEPPDNTVDWYQDFLEKEQPQ